MGGGTPTYRIAVARDNDTAVDEHYLFYTVALAAVETKVHDIGLQLEAGDVIRVYSSDGNVVFSIIGWTE